MVPLLQLRDEHATFPFVVTLEGTVYWKPPSLVWGWEKKKGSCSLCFFVFVASLKVWQAYSGHFPLEEQATRSRELLKEDSF